MESAAKAFAQELKTRPFRVLKNFAELQVYAGVHWQGDKGWDARSWMREVWSSKHMSLHMQKRTTRRKGVSAVYYSCSCITGTPGGQ